jgi:apolipoprotein D and lipocalin family protein
MKITFLMMASLALLLTSCAISNDDSRLGMRAVPQVDLNRYMGDWYVISNIPNRAENDCYDSIEKYRLREDGRIDNQFECRDGSFDKPLERRLDTIATIYDKTSNAEWRVKIFKVVQAKYLVIDLDPEYRWAVVGHPSRDYGWVLARDKSLSEETYSSILERLRGQGYDVSRFVKIPQQIPEGKS